MKKTILSVLALVLLLTSCDDSILTESTDSTSSGTTGSSSTSSDKNTSGTTSSESSDSSSGTSTDSQAEAESDSTGSSDSGSQTVESAYTYDSSLNANVFEIPSSISSITITGLSSGKNVFLTKTNPTSSTISSNYTRYVSSASGISLSSGDSVTASSTSSSGSSSSGKSSGPRHDCTSLSLNLALPQIEENTSRAATTTLTKVTPAAYTQSDVGSATRSIYVDQDSNISTFKAESATLRAVGENCYVWVVSANWTSSSANGEKINSEIAQKIAENFDAMYGKIRAVFGGESDFLASSTSLSSKIAMSDYSETGEIVNIVIYDIGKDYSNGTNSGDIVGYFYAKDYFYLSNASSVYKYSNKGKYFYIDGYFAANYTSEVYSTLAHEFQHMIDFGVKSMENGVTTSTAYNEMKSMLCEDIMYSTLCALDSEFSEDDSPVSRLPLFNRHYADIGLEYKSSSPEVYYSYSNNYAFGAWLLRNYGGIQLLNEIATNSYADEKAILKALKTTGAEAESMEELLKNYTVSCVISADDFGFAKNLSDSELDFSGYAYSLEPIDLWNLANALPETYTECKNSTSYYKFDGPVLYGYNAQVALRPYGITLQKVGTTTSDTVTISLNTSGYSTSQKVYVVVE